MSANPLKRYKDKTQLTHKAGSRSITAKRYNYINLTITAKRASDKNSITARRAFRRMAGLAVLYPSVVDCMGWRVKTLSGCLPDDFRGYSVNLCQVAQDQSQ